MIENLAIYFPNLVAALLGSIALALLGALLNARGEVLQAMLASQSSGLGISIGLVVGILAHFLPFVVAVFFAGASFVISQVLVKKWRAKATPFLLSMFLLSLSLNYLVTASFPALETHFASSFLGDIATTSTLSCWYFSALSLISIGVLFFNWRAWVMRSFWSASSDVVFSREKDLLFYFLAGVLVVESTRILGFLVTMSSLVILPLAVSLFAVSLRSFRLILVGTNLLSTGLAFVISMRFESLPTSAVIGVLHAAVGVLLVLVVAFRFKASRQPAGQSGSGSI